VRQLIIMGGPSQSGRFLKARIVPDFGWPTPSQHAVAWPLVSVAPYHLRRVCSSRTLTAHFDIDGAHQRPSAIHIAGGGSTLRRAMLFAYRCGGSVHSSLTASKSVSSPTSRSRWCNAFRTRGTAQENQPIRGSRGGRQTKPATRTACSPTKRAK
jgi:hypothetical protein